ncbi:DUF3152 domain-containing protein [Georgenia sp. Z1491]|uniref:DUF3152 domain-containing protein n=1 Tax=Georgenia sp. Z1491 TaxID=3416707 RepID=UPI003CEA9FFC
MSDSRRLPTVLGVLACAALVSSPLLAAPTVADEHAAGSDVDLRAAWAARPGPLLPDDDEPTLLELVQVPDGTDGDGTAADGAGDTDVDLPEGVDEDAYGAGIRGDLVAAEGSGSLRVVAGTDPAPREAERTYSVRVEVERGLPVDREAFADYVLDTLNDDRGWGHDGSVAFERVDGEDADFGVTLADGPLSIELCEPLDVGGIYSCGRNGRAVLNADRFGESIEPFLEAGGTLPQYRQYLVNHEVGHLLGYQHVDCPAPGDPAPVMVQQSISLQDCVPNAWVAEE